jgi:chemotaxis protein methyltransferase CheR
MRWAGFRKVRRQVCRRIARRMEEVGCADMEAYRALLAHHQDEWRILDGLCRITISRFIATGTFDAWTVFSRSFAAGAGTGRSELRC